MWSKQMPVPPLKHCALTCLQWRWEGGREEAWTNAACENRAWYATKCIDTDSQVKWALDVGRGPGRRVKLKGKRSREGAERESQSKALSRGTTHQGQRRVQPHGRDKGNNYHNNTTNQHGFTVEGKELSASVLLSLTRSVWSVAHPSPKLVFLSWYRNSWGVSSKTRLNTGHISYPRRAIRGSYD